MGVRPNQPGTDSLSMHECQLLSLLPLRKEGRARQHQPGAREPAGTGREGRTTGYALSFDALLGHAASPEE